MTDANRKSERATGGFTLLEVMLAVTILGLLLATVYGAVTRTQSSKEHAEDRAELFAGGRQAVLKIAGDVEAALPPPSGDRIYFRGQPAREGALIEFVTVNRGGYGVNRVRPGRVLIVYSLDPIAHEKGAFALRREEYLYAAMLAEADGVELAQQKDFGLGEEDEEPEQPTAQASYLLDCPNVAQEFNLPGSCMRVLALRFRYYDDVVRDWREEWDSTQEAMLNRLPAAVEVALLLADQDGGEHDFSTIVDLPLARGQPTPQPGGGGGGGGNDPDDADDADDQDDDPPPTRRR